MLPSRRLNSTVQKMMTIGAGWDSSCPCSEISRTDSVAMGLGLNAIDRLKAKPQILLFTGLLKQF